MLKLLCPPHLTLGSALLAAVAFCSVSCASLPSGQPLHPAVSPDLAGLLEEAGKPLLANCSWAGATCLAVLEPLPDWLPPPIPELQFPEDSIYYGLPLPPLPLYPLENDSAELYTYLQQLADFYESQELLYRSAPLSDCSGLLHRVLRSLQAACPDYAYPSPTEARDSRALARWYYEREQLVIIEQAADSSHLIRPGAILFFGRSGRRFKSPDLATLTAARGIQHVGLVVDVEYDEDGQVAAYTLFHATRPGKRAGRSIRYRSRPGSPHLPAYGNWKQQLVAMAPLWPGLPASENDGFSLAQ